MIELLIFSLITLLFAFILLYPFYLQGHAPARYKGAWRAIGSMFKNRYGAIWVLIVYLGINVFTVADIFTRKHFIGLLATFIYFSLFTPVFLWYPFYLKERRPEKYRGIWKRIGEWLGDPRVAFPSSRD